MRGRQSDCIVVWRIIKRRGMIKWVIDSNGGQRVEWPVSSSVACGQIRLAYPSLSSSWSSWSSSEIAPFPASFSEMRHVLFFLPCVCQWSFFEDYTCGSYHGVGYQPTRKIQAVFSKGPILIYLYLPYICCDLNLNLDKISKEKADDSRELFFSWADGEQ